MFAAHFDGVQAAFGLAAYHDVFGISQNLLESLADYGVIIGNNDFNNGVLFH